MERDGPRVSAMLGLLPQVVTTRPRQTRPDLSFHEGITNELRTVNFASGCSLGASWNCHHKPPPGIEYWPKRQERRAPALRVFSQSGNRAELEPRALGGGVSSPDWAGDGADCNRAYLLSVGPAIRRAHVSRNHPDLPASRQSHVLGRHVLYRGAIPRQ